MGIVLRVELDDRTTIEKPVDFGTEEVTRMMATKIAKSYLIEGVYGEVTVKGNVVTTFYPASQILKVVVEEA